MKKHNPSSEQLAKSQSRRVSSLMVRTLQRFEDMFPDLECTREGRTFKGDLKAMFNDIIRAGRDELNDYVIDYRPLHLTQDNTLAMSRTFLQTVQVIDFSFTEGGEPSITFQAAKDKLPILDAMRAEFNAGIVCLLNEDQAILRIVGTETCVRFVLPIMDKFRVHETLRQKYRDWRQAIAEKYWS